MAMSFGDGRNSNESDMKDMRRTIYRVSAVFLYIIDSSWSVKKLSCSAIILILGDFDSTTISPLVFKYTFSVSPSLPFTKNSILSCPACATEQTTTHDTPTTITTRPTINLTKFFFGYSFTASLL